jgi:hypothetical protein
MELETEHVVAQCLWRHAISRKGAGSRPDEVNNIYNLPNHSCHTRPWCYQASNRNGYQKQTNNGDGRLKPR